MKKTELSINESSSLCSYWKRRKVFKWKKDLQINGNIPCSKNNQIVSLGLTAGFEHRERILRSSNEVKVKRLWHEKLSSFINFSVSFTQRSFSSKVISKFSTPCLHYPVIKNFAWANFLWQNLLVTEESPFSTCQTNVRRKSNRSVTIIQTLLHAIDKLFIIVKWKEKAGKCFIAMSEMKQRVWMISVYNFDWKFCLPKKLRSRMPHSKKEKKEEH